MNKIMTVPFYGTEMYAFQLGSVIVVALKPIVQGMGLDWSGQLKRVKRDPILKEGVVMMSIPRGHGDPQEQVCLRSVSYTHLSGGLRSVKMAAERN